MRCVACRFALSLLLLLTLFAQTAVVAFATPAVSAPNMPRKAGVLRVPLDFPTIQAAIDAAQPGDEIRVVMATYGQTDPGYFKEHLIITKTLTLDGGWNAGFTEVVGKTDLRPNENGGAGRGITISASAPITVTIRRLNVYEGDASGQGCGNVELSALSSAPEFLLPESHVAVNAAAMPIPSTPSAAAGADAVMAEWMARLESLAAQGRYPGSAPSLQRLQARIGQLTVAQPSAPVPEPSFAPATPAATMDCGGGLFAEGANLIIEQSGFYFNVASETGRASGGGVFFASGNLLQIEDSSFAENVAANSSAGSGGGLSVDDIPSGGRVLLRGLDFHRNTAALLGGQGGGVSINAYNLTVDVTVEACNFRENVGGRLYRISFVSSSGGGLSVESTPGVRLVDNQFLLNSAALDGIEGRGGGLFVNDSADAVISGNTFNNNIANAQGAYHYVPGKTNTGFGGGVFLIGSKRVQVTDNLFAENIAGLQVAGQGGGLAAYVGDNATYSGNRFVRNFAAYRPQLHFSPDDSEVSQGGAFFLAGGDHVTVTQNVFSENYAVFYDPFATHEFGMGGGLDIYGLADSVVAGNVFTANVACGNCRGHGGGIAIHGAYGGAIEQPENITVTANSLVDNAGSLTGEGIGGGVYLYNVIDVLVQANRVVDNQASAAGSGVGGGIALSPFFGPEEPIVTSGNVRIDGNIVTGNRAATEAGGVLAWGPDPTVVANNLIVDNHASRGGGLAFFGASPNIAAPQGTLVNNTIVGNAAEGILLSHWLSSTLSAVNNIVVSHTIGLAAADASRVDLRYTLWYANGIDVTPGIAQTHGLSAPPGFVSPATGDYRLTVASAARDAGDPAGVPPAPPFDLAGTPRPFGPRVDLGAYEWSGWLSYLPMVASRP